MRGLKPGSLTDGIVSLREIAPQDAKLLYVLRMDSSSRKMFRNTRLISFAAHRDLVERYGHCQSRDCWLVIEAAGQPVGTISLYNFSDSGDSCEWGRFAVAPEARHRGYGGRALRLLMAFAQTIGVARLQCEVLATNSIALSLYRKLGFTQISEEMHEDRSFLTLAADLQVRV